MKKLIALYATLGLLFLSTSAHALQYFDDLMPAPNQERLDAIFMEKWQSRRNQVSTSLVPKSNKALINKVKKNFEVYKEGEYVYFESKTANKRMYAIATSGHENAGRATLSYQFNVGPDKKVSKGTLFITYKGERPLNPQELAIELADRTMAVPIPRGMVGYVTKTNGEWFYEYSVEMDEESENILTAHLLGNGLKNKIKGIFIINGGMGAEFYEFPQSSRTKFAEAILLRKALEKNNLGESLSKLKATF